MEKYTVNLTSDELDTLAVAMDSFVDSLVEIANNDDDESVNDAKKLRDYMYDKLHEALEKEGVL